MNQDLMFFEAETVAAEAAKCDAQRAAEEQARAARTAAKVLLQAAREKTKAEKLAKADDWRRRTAQARTYKTPDEHAQCGIRWTTMREAQSSILGNHLVAGLGSQLPQPERPRHRLLLAQLPQVRPALDLHQRPSRQAPDLQSGHRVMPRAA